MLIVRNISLDTRLKSNLIVASLLLLISCALSAKEGDNENFIYEKCHGHGHPCKRIIDKRQYSYFGDSNFEYPVSYSLLINLKNIKSVPSYQKEDELPESHLSPEQTEEVWHALKDIFPVSADFLIAKAKFLPNQVALVKVSFEEAWKEVDIDISELILKKWKVYVPSVSEPKFRYFTEAHNWNKAKGYRIAKKIFDSNEEGILGIEILLEDIQKNGKTDIQGYYEIFKRADIYFEFDLLYSMPDGTKLMKMNINKEKLEALISEPSVLSIIPYI